MTEKRFTLVDDYLIRYDGSYFDLHKPSDIRSLVTVIRYVTDENEQLKKELKRCKDWINSDKNDYELTLAFIKNKGYLLQDVLEYEKELKMNE